MTQAALNENLRLATIERIARYTVGIGVGANTVVGTGTLIASGQDRYVLTARHVIEDILKDGAFSEIRFLCRPPAPIIEKAAKDVTDTEIAAAKFTMGTSFPIEAVLEDARVDVALLKIDPTFQLPGAAEYYDLRRACDFKNWPAAAILEGLLLFMYGYPTDNSRPLHTEGDHTTHFLGSASHYANYSSETNTKHWANLSKTKFSPETDFLFDYVQSQGIKGHGFSGAGIWIMTDVWNRLVWGSDPALIGMAFRSVEAPPLIAAAKLPTILELLHR
jgi:hypothetical protein